MPAKDPARRRATARTWYARNKEMLAARDGVQRRAKRLARRNATAAWYSELKSRLVCVRCGENHPACLQFHHADPSSKRETVADAIRRGWSRARVLDEINKCHVLCANCHAKVHAAGTAP